MADQQFRLRWNNHQNTIISVFDDLLESESLVDCTLAAEGQFVRAHKVVLSACSPFFSDLLREHYEKHPILIMKDVKFYQLKAMLEYMYRGEVNISQDELGTFLKAAESLQIKGLSDSSQNCDSANKTKASPPPSRTSRSVSRVCDEDPTVPRSKSISPTPRKRKRHLHSENVDVVTENSASEPVVDAMNTPVQTDIDSVSPVREEESSLQETVGFSSNRILSSAVSISFKNGSPRNQPSSVDSAVPISSDTEFVDVSKVEDLTLEEDNIEAVPSHSSSDAAGFTWHVDRSTEDIPLSSQESHSGYRNAQDTWFPTLPLQQEVAPLQYGPFSCPRCGRKYAVLYTLERHLRYECGVDKQFGCPVCHRRFSRRDVLRTHQKNSGHFTETETSAKTFMDMIALSATHRKE